jgi:hypothetical protein
VAQVCERLALAHIADQAGLAYVVGLCHDLTDIFIRTQFSKEYQQVIEAAAKTGRPREQLYAEMLGMTPGQTIAAVLNCISLPAAIREPIELFHAPGGSRATGPLARILWMAENYANAAMLASGPGAEVAPLTQSFCRAAVGDPNPPRPEPLTLRSQIQTLTVMLARLSRADQEKLLAPMFETKPARLWLVRDPSISEFDPIGLALESLCAVDIHPRLPVAREVDGVDGLFVIAPPPSAATLSQRQIEAALVAIRGGGRILPALVVKCDGTRTGNQAEGVCWRASVTLSELAGFVGTLTKHKTAEAA